MKTNLEDLISPFLGNQVEVTIQDYVVCGKLMAFIPPSIVNHKPQVLIIENNGLHIIRGKFHTIKLLESSGGPQK